MKASLTDQVQNFTTTYLDIPLTKYSAMIASLTDHIQNFTTTYLDIPLTRSVL